MCISKVGYTELLVSLFTGQRSLGDFSGGLGHNKLKEPLLSPEGVGPYWHSPVCIFPADKETIGGGKRAC